MYEHNGMIWFGGVMWIIWLLVIVAVVFLVRFIIGGGSSSATTDSALEILKKRYVSGEIDESEYHRRRKELER